jgi:hypothetical protein
MSRRIFNWIHVELSVMLGHAIPRMELWSEIGGMFPPQTLTYEQGLEFLESRKLVLRGEHCLSKIIKRYKKWEPNRETPEEILERICSGISK